MAIGIKGIDEGVFKELLDSDEDLFISLLNSFVSKTPSVLGKLATVTRETLTDYAKNVHGLKGACANICAEEARKMAFSLEQKSRAGDFDGVMAENGPFLNYMQELMDRLQDWLKKH